MIHFRGETPTVEDLRALIYNPAEMTGMVLELAQRMRDANGVIWGIPCLDKVLNPGKGGDTLGILGRPSNGKSTMLARLERTEATRLIVQGRSFPKGHDIVVHVTYEQTVEQADVLNIASPMFSSTDILRGKLSDEDIMRAMWNREELPIWHMGESVVRRKHHARMTIDNVYAGLRMLEAEFKVKPTLIGIDYLQLVPSDGSMEGKTAEVAKAIEGAKELGRATGAMMAIALQAGRAADRRTEGLPEKEDNQHASAIEQAIDAEISLYRPVTNRKGKVIKFDWEGQELELSVTEAMLLARIVKNRNGPTGDTFMLHCVPQFMQIGEMDMAALLPPPGSF